MAVVDIEQTINRLYNTPSDINEHFPTIVKYGSECNTITEFGVRAIVSTWGWLSCIPKKLTCYDLHYPDRWSGDLQSVYDTAEHLNVNFKFIQADSLLVNIEQTDLLFIDTWHVYDQLKKELHKHESFVNKYICLHDTTSYEFVNESNSSEHSLNDPLTKQGLWPAVEEFLETNTNWILKERFTNNNGFTILERITKP
jgi:hypothetical protein